MSMEEEFEEFWADEAFQGQPVWVKTLAETIWLHQQEKIDSLRAILSDLVNSVEFLNPFDSGHPNIKLRIDLTKAKELLKEQP